MLSITIPLLVGFVIVHRFFVTSIHYRYSLAKVVKDQQYDSRHWYKFIFYVLRFSVLLVLVFVAAKPQLVDSRSKIFVEGIDIMMVLDASGSMQFQDYSEDERSRFDVAKEEAIRFVKKRINDSVGLVVFGNDAISRCPLTLDKNIVSDIIEKLQLGDIDPDGTVLATAVITAVNRLKNSNAATKIMIVLTDGAPSQNDMNIGDALEIAKKFAIKIYTVGIGSDRDVLFMHPTYGVVEKPKVNTLLLQQIARETGGKFFMAHNDQDMRDVYETINKLERTKHEAPLYSNYFDIIVPCLILVLCFLFLEQSLASSVWFHV